MADLIETWLEAKADLSSHVEMDKAWEPIHRCLTGDDGRASELDFDAGTAPLKLCVLGGEQLLHEGHRSAALITSAEVPALAAALAAVRKEWFRDQFFALPDAQFHEIDDTVFQWTWESFEMLPPFFAAVASSGGAVICTISH